MTIEKFHHHQAALSQIVSRLNEAIIAADQDGLQTEIDTHQFYQKSSLLIQVRGSIAYRTALLSDPATIVSERLKAREETEAMVRAIGRGQGEVQQ